jgi:hypothetical protein
MTAISPLLTHKPMPSFGSRNTPVKLLAPTGTTDNHGNRRPLPRFALNPNKPSLFQSHQRSTGCIAFDIQGLQGFLRQLEGFAFGHAVQPPQRNADVQGLTR